MDIPPALPLGAVVPYGDGWVGCTAVRVGAHRAVTVGHCVASMMERSGGFGAIAGEPTMPTALVRDADAAVMTVPPGPVAGIAYDQSPGPRWLVGYGCVRGHRALDVRRAEQRPGRDPDGEVELTGWACHGDSGGAVFRADGALTGIITGVGIVRGADGRPHPWVTAVPIDAALPPPAR